LGRGPDGIMNEGKKETLALWGGTPGIAFVGVAGGEEAPSTSTSQAPERKFELPLLDRGWSWNSRVESVRSSIIGRGRNWLGWTRERVRRGAFAYLNAT